MHVLAFPRLSPFFLGHDKLFYANSEAGPLLLFYLLFAPVCPPQKETLLRKILLNKGSKTGVKIPSNRIKFPQTHFSGHFQTFTPKHLTNFRLPGLSASSKFRESPIKP